MMRRVLPILALLLSCEREYTVEELCAGEGPAEVQLGGTGGADFVPFTDGEDVYITVAPQGGYGVAIRAQTLGAMANNNVNLVMWSTWNGAPTGTFDWGEIPLYCQDDGHGLFFSAIVPLDPEQFPTVEDLLVLEGERVILNAQITDVRGVEIQGSVGVTLHVREEDLPDTGDTGS